MWPYVIPFTMKAARSVTERPSVNSETLIKNMDSCATDSEIRNFVSDSDVNRRSFNSRLSARK